MEAIKKYLRSCHGVIRAPLAHVIRKNIIVGMYSDYQKHRSPDDEMIARMLHLPLERTSSFQRVIFSQLKCIHLSRRSTVDVSMASWIRSARTEICTHMLNSISLKEMAAGNFMPFIPDG